MIKIENVEVMGWEAAIRGMRNPMNSWDKIDSGFCYMSDINAIIDGEFVRQDPVEHTFCIGKNDLNLMTRLAKAGSDHRKFMRMITVYLDITAPFYLWKEISTYKVGTVANSCSTMHKIHTKEFTLSDFSCEHLYAPLQDLKPTIDLLNMYRERYLETKDKNDWWQLIQLLPSSYNQRRTVMLNYEVLANMYKSRRNHKLDEWQTFCDWIESLPYSQLITRKETVNEIREES